MRMLILILLVVFSTNILFSQPNWHKVDYNELTQANALFEFNDTLIIFDWAGSKAFLHYLYKKDHWSKKEIQTDRVIEMVYFVNSTVGYGISGGSGDNPEQIYRTTNGGDSWQALYKFPKHIDGPFFRRECIKFFENGTGYIVGQSTFELYKTTDGGISFSKLADLKNPTYSINFLNDSYGWIGGNGFNAFCNDFNNRYVLKLTNGNNLQCQKIPPEYTVNSTSSLNQNLSWFNRQYELLKTTDGGNSFIQINIPDSCKAGWGKISVINEEILWFSSGNRILSTLEASKNKNPLKWSVYEFKDILKIYDFQIINNGSEGWAISSQNIYHYPDECIVSVFNQLPSKKMIVISPNPTGDRLKLLISDFVNNSPLSIFNLYGQKVYDGVMNMPEKEIDVSTFAPGVYFVVVGEQRQMFIKQ